MSARLKRNAVVVTMALLVCAAAALNWKYTGQQTEKTPAAQTGETAPESGTKILGEATLVSGGEGSEAGDEETVYTGSDYFASARLTRQHNDTNMMAMGAGVVGTKLALEIVDTWLDTAFEGGRHQRRVDKLMALENE